MPFGALASAPKTVNVALVICQNATAQELSNACVCWSAGPGSLDTEPSLLTSAQAMADYALLINSYKADHGAQSSAVIAFGGSYGGMVRRPCTSN